MFCVKSGSKGQGAFEYILLVGGALAIVVLVLVILRGTISGGGAGITTEMDKLFCGGVGSPDVLAATGIVDNTKKDLRYSAAKKTSVAGVNAQVDRSTDMTVSIYSDAGVTKLRDDITVPCSSGACSQKWALDPNVDNVQQISVTVQCLNDQCGSGSARAIRCV